jgi:hypothetical protein
MKKVFLSNGGGVVDANLLPEFLKNKVVVIESKDENFKYFGVYHFGEEVISSSELSFGYSKGYVKEYDKYYPGNYEAFWLVKGETEEFGKSLKLELINAPIKLGDVEKFYVLPLTKEHFYNRFIDGYKKSRYEKCEKPSNFEQIMITTEFGGNLEEPKKIDVKDELEAYYGTFWGDTLNISLWDTKNLELIHNLNLTGAYETSMSEKLNLVIAEVVDDCLQTECESLFKMPVEVCLEAVEMVKTYEKEFEEILNNSECFELRVE